ncbi:cupredoxin domain-containing protein [Piscinibacter terrae]|uniref:Blue (type 1) copper domain-containing protein n=1 Tax=Piscinibacter terrae TaxID=2496871 RepID=A0A3N7HID8_9BURK|nr:cupredoxin family protein [Albitalea terrae]RQP21810.1 hypothetical protein DZC73_25550 [Albitalea terrae]
MPHAFRTASLAALALALSSAMALAVASGSHEGGHDEARIGEAGQSARVSRTINVDMVDAMRFTPSSISVKQGETIRFVVKNSGQVKHELVLGTGQQLKEHYALMLKNPEMEHADANQITVAPGKTGDVIWRFTQPGKVDFACLQPGHLDAGMKGLVNVVPVAQPGAADGHTTHKH